jgi:hypothetical protein
MRLWYVGGLVVVIALSLIAYLHFRSPGPSRTHVQIPTGMNPGRLRLSPSDGVLFCDSTGEIVVDFASGKSRRVGESCSQFTQPGSACVGEGARDIVIRSPQTEVDDIVDLPVKSIRVSGRVHSCIADSKWIAVATGSSVILIDNTDGAVKPLSSEGPSKLALNDRVIAWLSLDQKLQIVSVNSLK